MLIAICYIVLAYFFNRKDFEILLGIFSVAFLSTYFLMNDKKLNAGYFFKIGLIFRIIFLFSTPFLSQDFYRFIWDGNLTLLGISPYELTPNELINTLETLPNDIILHEKMGILSASNYSNYPPINQLFFFIASFFGNKSILFSIIILRIFIILADVCIYFLGKKILVALGQNPNKIFWYFLNPLVILELTANLHFEGVMLFFIIGSLYLLHQNKWQLSAIIMALSISTKLLPLFLLPLFFQRLNFKKSFLYYSIVLVLNFLFFLPFITPKLINNYIKTIGLWFTNFEFNASIYYLIREVGFWIKGYNIIQTTGKLIPILIIIFIIYRSFISCLKTTQSLFLGILVVFSVYFFTATTVHPWYIINLVLIAVFTKYKFPFVWSFVVILSYSAYSDIIFKEKYCLIFLEYLVVFGFLIWEMYFKVQKNLDFYKQK